LLGLLFLTSLLAFGLSAIAGGGASLLVVPVLGRVVGVAGIPAALSIGTSASSFSRILAFRRAIHWGIVAWFVPAALPMALAGALLLRFLNPAYLQVVMALFLLANLPLLLRPQSAPVEGRPTRRKTMVVGAAAGFLSGLTGAVGVLFNRFYFTHGLRKEQIVATRATNEVLVHLIKLLVYARLGLLDRDALVAGTVVGVAAILSSLLLKPALHYISQLTFVRVGYAAMVVSGLTLLTDSVARVVRQDRVAFDARPIVSGVDATLHWRDSSLTIEMDYDDGLEIELGRELSDLPPALRALVAAQQPKGTDVAIEEVYGLEGRSFEAYYTRAGRQVRKISFDARGATLVDER
jgi:uncharacterized membrane protein YfcA